MRAGQWLCTTLLVTLMSVPVASGQSSGSGVGASASGPARVEVSVSGLLATGGDLGGSNASLLENRVPTGGTVRLFQTDARLATAPGAEVRGAVRLSRGWRVEGGVGYTRPILEVVLSNDYENAAGVTATTRVTQVIVDGALVHRWETGRLSPFILGGAGYLRQLDTPRTTVGTGQVYFGGGGLTYGLGAPRPGAGHRVRIRGDVRVVSYAGGLPLIDERPVGVVAGAGITFALW